MWAVAGGLVAALLSAAPALGGTVSVSGNTLAYDAALLELNTLTVEMSDDRTLWTVTETTAPLVIGAGCEPGPSPQTAECDVPNSTADAGVDVDLGDGLDYADLSDACQGFSLSCPIVAQGGSGNDTIIGRSSEDELYGGIGDDTLEGRGELFGRSGNDMLMGTGGALLDGGQGSDTMDSRSNACRSEDDVGFADSAVYTTRTRPVTVTIDDRLANDGERGENDLVLVQEAIGGSGDDRLTGSGCHNDLRGGPGDDLIRGLGAFDWLWGDSEPRVFPWQDKGSCEADARGGGGADRLYAGQGQDVVWGCGGADVLRGGTTLDDLFGGAGDDVLHGGNGADELFGGFGSDRLTGGGWMDDLWGQAGPDWLRARDGRSDELYGGLGTDRGRYDQGLDNTHSVERTF